MITKNDVMESAESGNESKASKPHASNLGGSIFGGVRVYRGNFLPIAVRATPKINDGVDVRCPA